MESGGTAATAIGTVEPVLIVVGGAIIALLPVALGIRWVKATFFLIEGGFGLPFFLVLVMKNDPNSYYAMDGFSCSSCCFPR